MSELFALFERKLLCLKSFEKICVEFLENVVKKNIDGLEDFKRKREGILKVVVELDTEITRAYSKLSIENQKEEKIAQYDIRCKNTLQSIINTDKSILSGIEAAKTEVFQKLQSLKGARKTISAYRSPLAQVENSEAITKVDQKA